MSIVYYGRNWAPNKQNILALASLLVIVVDQGGGLQHENSSLFFVHLKGLGHKMD